MDINLVLADGLREAGYSVEKDDFFGIDTIAISKSGIIEYPPIVAGSRRLKQIWLVVVGHHIKISSSSAVIAGSVELDLNDPTSIDKLKTILAAYFVDYLDR